MSCFLFLFFSSSLFRGEYPLDCARTTKKARNREGEREKKRVKKRKREKTMHFFLFSPIIATNIHIHTHTYTHLIRFFFLTIETNIFVFDILDKHIFGQILHKLFLFENSSNTNIQRILQNCWFNRQRSFFYLLLSWVPSFSLHPPTTIIILLIIRSKRNQHRYIIINGNNNRNLQQQRLNHVQVSHRSTQKATEYNRLNNWGRKIKIGC